MTVIARITSDAKIQANSFNTQQLAWDLSNVIEETNTLEDTTVFDESAELDTLITYLFDNNEPALEDLVLDNLFFDELGNIFAHGFYTTEPSFEATENIEDTINLDDTYNFDDTGSSDLLIKYLFDLTVTETPITKISFHNNKMIAANDFVVGLE